MQRFGFLLMDGYGLMSAATAVEPLRAVNVLAGRTLYRAEYFSEAGGAVSSSCGGKFETRPLAEASDALDILFVIAGGAPMLLEAPGVFARLRARAARGGALGGISGGSALLARAGLMANRRFTIHWEHFEALRDYGPDLLLERRLFVIDRDRATCAGGVAPLDMMHALIRARHGAELASRVSDWFIHTGVRLADEPQRAREGQRDGTRALHHVTLAALKLMEDHLADPLSLEQLADLCGLSARQLQRRVQDDFGDSVMRRYVSLRLEKGAELLRQTRMPVSEIAVAVGFSSQSNFARAFAAAYGRTPLEHRRGAFAARD